MTPDQDARKHRDAIEAVVSGTHGDPFAILGTHRSGDVRVVRTLQPQARKVALVDAEGRELANAEKVHDGGLFTAILPPRLRRYELRVTLPSGDSYVSDDPYRFPPTLGEMDLYLLGEGSDRQIYEKLGAQLRSYLGIHGTRFAVWAPNASRVSVVGSFNDWDGRRHGMRLHPGNGIWEIFIPGVGHGDKYKFEMLDQEGKLLPLKSDPYAAAHEPPPGNASIVYASSYEWHDDAWIERRDVGREMRGPMSIYEVHLGSWRRGENNAWLNYRDLADQLVDYVADMGFTHIEFLPVTEHPFDGSWGYQPIGLFAPTWRFGPPDDFRYLVDKCHQAGIGIIIDWVPAHFPKDEHGLRRFDGTALYEHADPRKGEHADWGTLIFNYGRREVRNYLIGSALCWIREFHVDALRVDAVASMLYLDYSREDGEWVPNEFGGNENLEAVEFLKQLNVEVHAYGATTHAEESTAWPAVSRPIEHGGLGFTYKWNMGWMHDTLAYMQEDPVHRIHHHDKMTFGLVYAFNENFVLPLSHDEVVHGKRSILGRMPGDDWQRFANLRAYYASMYAHPGKKLLFMGAEIAQSAEWNHDVSLDWHLLEYAPHAGVQRLVRELNKIHKSVPALHEVDFTGDGFEWLDLDDRANSVFSWLRKDSAGHVVVCICNLTPVVRSDYRVAVPCSGAYDVLINTDAATFDGSGHEPGTLIADDTPHHGRNCSLRLSLPPLATLILAPASEQTDA